MLHLIYVNKRRDQVQNDDIYDRLEITPLGVKLVQQWWRCLDRSNGDLQRHQCVL
jgi:glutathionylspermidine synthase